MGFNDFVQYYSLERTEGVLLRYLSDAYKALPPSRFCRDGHDWRISGLFGGMMALLVDEWEKLAAGEDTATVRLHRGGRASRRRRIAPSA